MGVVTKKIGKGAYAYLVVREGQKIAHRYLGPAENPKVKQLIAEREETRRVPGRFRAFFWDTNPAKIHLKKHARNVIERILEYGTLDAVEWLQRVYPAQTILETLRTSRQISERSRGFWELWFGGRHA